jgi:fido (protein-threonine AMPylation protein)
MIQEAKPNWLCPFANGNCSHFTYTLIKHIQHIQYPIDFVTGYCLDQHRYVTELKSCKVYTPTSPDAYI